MESKQENAIEVGKHRITVDIPCGVLSEKELTPYMPFRAVSCNRTTELFSLTLTADPDILPKSGTSIARFDDENGRMELFALPSGEMTIHLSSVQGGECCRLLIEPGYCHAIAWIGGTDSERRYGFDTAMMLLYTFASSTLGTLLLHASVVEYGGRGYLFLGRSGTGKSTHSRLWIEHVPGTRLLNDDNPIVRIIDGVPMVFGSPWSGKTPCYLDRSVPLGAIVRLHQAPHNRITRLSGAKAYAALLPSCSCMKWDSAMATAVHNTIGKVITTVPVFDLECTPDREAAMLCMTTVTGVCL